MNCTLKWKNDPFNNFVKVIVLNDSTAGSETTNLWKKNSTFDDYGGVVLNIPNDETFLRELFADENLTLKDDHSVKSALIEDLENLTEMNSNNNTTYDAGTISRNRNFSDVGMISASLRDGLSGIGTNDTAQNRSTNFNTTHVPIESETVS